jgi:hypothetical protein
MDDVGTRLFEDAIKTPQTGWKVPAQIRVYGNALIAHLLAKYAKGSNCMNAWLVPLFSL